MLASKSILEVVEEGVMVTDKPVTSTKEVDEDEAVSVLCAD